MPAVAEMVRPAGERLMALAPRAEVVSYTELAVALGTIPRVVPMVLKVIQGRCLERGLPDLSALVVGKAGGLPGAAFFAPYRLDGAAPARQQAMWEVLRTTVQGHDWTAHPLRL